MLQIRKIMLRGPGKADAFVEFNSGANVLAGESDTGKSYLLSCLNFILGSDALDYLKEGTPYTQLLVEFKNSQNEPLTFSRLRDDSHLTVHRTPISAISGDGEIVTAVRKGKSKRADVTSVLFPFCGIPEAKVRRNAEGDTQRLTVRTLAPLFLIDEVSIIDKSSPVTGKRSYDETARKRTLSFILSGKDDAGVTAAKKNDVVKASLKAKIEVLTELLLPLETRFSTPRVVALSEETDTIESAIQNISKEIGGIAIVEAGIQQKTQETTKNSLKAHSQLIGIGELLSRYRLLDELYESDLHRLDFISEGSFYLSALQDVVCPVCDQVIPSFGHSHDQDNDLDSVRNSALAEAAKIQAHRSDLVEAISDLERRKFQAGQDKERLDGELQSLQAELSNKIVPQLKTLAIRHQSLIQRRSELDIERSDRERLAALLKRRNEIQESLDSTGEPARKWDTLPPDALRKFCEEIESILEEWSWKGKRRVEFDEKTFDIVIDGQPRQSHGKGVRAVLYAAFAIGLLRFCAANKTPHPGLVVIDSPLTAYKKKKAASVSGSDDGVDPGVEAAFWKSLAKTPSDIQVIVLENKEPPEDIAEVIHYEWFAGSGALAGERAGLIPK